MKAEEYKINEALRKSGAHEIMKSEINRYSKNMNSYLENLADVKRKMPNVLEFFYKSGIDSANAMFSQYNNTAGTLAKYIDTSGYVKNLRERLENYVKEVRKYKPKSLVEAQK